MTPSFDEIVGSEFSAEERDRLQRVHELLVVAGPPPELPPQLEQAPSPDETVHRLRRKGFSRRTVILLAAALTIGVVFVGGFSVGRHSGGKLAQAVTMLGTRADPSAHGQLAVFEPKHGNYEMTLAVTDLKYGHYEVYLVRNGKPWGSCGTFRVTPGSDQVTVSFSVPYALRHGDSWVVTRELPGQHGPGQTVLRPSARV